MGVYPGHKELKTRPGGTGWGGILANDDPPTSPLSIPLQAVSVPTAPFLFLS